MPRQADGSLDCLRSRAHYLETEVIPVDSSGGVHDASLLCADAAPRVLVLQPSNLVVLISSPSLAALVFSSAPTIQICLAGLGLKKV